MNPSRTISEKQQFQSKIANFSHPPRVFNAPAEGFPWNWVLKSN